MKVSITIESNRNQNRIFFTLKILLNGLTDQSLFKSEWLIDKKRKVNLICSIEKISLYYRGT